MKILHKIINIKHYIAAMKLKRLNAKNEEFIKHSYNVEANIVNSQKWETVHRIEAVESMRIDRNLETSWGMKL